MIFIKNIRNIYDEYQKSYNMIPDTEENFLTTGNFEITPNADKNSIACSDRWPEVLVLQAEIISAPVNSPTIVQRINVDYIGKPNYLYLKPIFSSHSVIKNPNAFCEAIRLRFSNSGEYILDNEHFKIYSKKFNEYELQLKDNIIFEKRFKVQNQEQILEKYISTGTHALELVSDVPGVVTHVFAYAGFFEYGSHPANIEPSIFELEIENGQTCLRVAQLSEYRRHGIDPLKTQTAGNSTLLSSCDFSHDQSLSLYKEIKLGSVSVEITDSKNNKRRLKSYECTHIPKTNLINVFFK